MPTDPIAEANESIERLRQDVQHLADANRELAARLDAELVRSRARRNVATALAVGVALMVLTSQATKGRGGPVVETKKLVLTDEAGDKCASMYVSRDGRAVLAFYGQNHEVMLNLGSWADGSAGLQVYDDEGNTRLYVGNGTRDEAGMVVYDRSKRLVVKVPTLFSAGGPLFKLPPPGLPVAGKADHQ